MEKATPVSTVSRVVASCRWRISYFLVIATQEAQTYTSGKTRKGFEQTKDGLWYRESLIGEVHPRWPR